MANSIFSMRTLIGAIAGKIGCCRRMATLSCDSWPKIWRKTLMPSLMQFCVRSLDIGKAVRLLKRQMFDPIEPFLRVRCFRDEFEIRHDTFRPVYSGTTRPEIDPVA